MNRILAWLTVALLTLGATVAAADPGQPTHAVALHGAPKYGPDFQHFESLYENFPLPVEAARSFGERGALAPVSRKAARRR